MRGTARKSVFRFPTRTDTNRAVPPQYGAMSLIFRILQEQGLYLVYLYKKKRKTLITCAVSGQLSCSFDFANAKNWFSHRPVHFGGHRVLYDNMAIKCRSF